MLADAAVEVTEFAGPVVLDLEGVGPKLAIERLRLIFNGSNESPAAWAKCASIAAIWGNCPRTISSIRSGVKHWIELATLLYGSEQKAFPATMEGVLAWSNLFRCLGTFKNYFRHVHIVSHALDVPAPED